MPEDLGGGVPDVLRQVLVRRPEVGERRCAGVVGGRRRRRPRVEVARARELLRGEAGADDLAVDLDQAALGLARKDQPDDQDGRGVEHPEQHGEGEQRLEGCE